MDVDGIVVLGMHRSGSSLLAELAMRWGAGMPPEAELVPANGWNPRGYWEPQALVDFNRALLERLDASWLLPPDPAALVEAAHDAKLVEAARGLLRKARSTGAQPWLWKDPRLPFLLPFWQPIWGRVACLISIRHPQGTLASLRRRDGFPETRSQLLWQCSYHELLRRLDTEAPRCFVRYEALLADPAAESARLADFLDRCFARAPSTETRHAMRGAVQPQLDHSRGVPAEALQPAVEGLYAELCRRVHEPELPFSAEDWAPEPAWWRDHLAALREQELLAGRNAELETDLSRERTTRLELEARLQAYEDERRSQGPPPNARPGPLERALDNLRRWWEAAR